MKYILSLLYSLIVFTLSAQVVSTTVTKDLDTVVITKFTVGKTIKVGSFVWKDTTIVKDTFGITVKPYKPSTVPNKPPVAKPVASTTTLTLPATLKLSGLLSSDSDGQISTYAWSKVSGSGGTITSPTSSTTNVIGLVPGTYRFRLTVIDNNGASDTGDITVLVKAGTTTPPINAPPVARAGEDQRVTLPSTATLNGFASTDADGTIVSYRWMLGQTIVSNSSLAEIQFSTTGSFTYTLTVTDDKGATGTDNVTVTVESSIPPPTGTETEISVSSIPFSDPDIISPGRGAEKWHDGSARIPNPTESQPIGTENSLDVYYRFESHRLYNSNGTFNWSYFDGLVESAINRGQKLSFGIMHFNGDGGGGTSYGGGESAYPAHLHNQMQAEGTKDVLVSGEWLPNWNSPSFLKFLRDENTAIRNRLISERHTPTSGPNAGKSVLYGDAIYVIDIRGFGNWGEWHIGDIASQWNSQPNRPTIATLKAIIDAHTQVFDRWPLGMMIAAYDGGASGVPLFHPYPEVAHYALTAKNAWGDVGARRDQVGAPDGYLKNMLENNNLTYNGSPQFKTLFLNKWKTAPITGEPNPGVAAITGMVDLLGQINLYHHVSFGNGNYPIGSQLSTSTRNTIREGFKRAGYRIEIKTGGSVKVSAGRISITNIWHNVGVTPTYENWDVVYELVSASGSVTRLGISSFKPKLFLPQTLPTSVTDNFNVNLPSGNYTLRVMVEDPSGYRQRLPLAIQGRNSDGSYNLGTIKL